MEINDRNGMSELSDPGNVEAGQKPPAVRQRWIARGLAWLLILGSLAVYLPTYRWLVLQWWEGFNSSTGVVPLLISLGWLAATWKRWPNQQPRRAWLGALLVGTGLWLWLMAWSADASVWQGWSLSLTLAGLIWMYAGEGKVRAMWFPLFYLLFAFPLPNLIEQSVSPWLRLASAQAAYAVIHLAGWPGELRGTMVVGPQFSFDVTPVCSGLRAVHTFLVAGILAARLMHSRPRWFWIQTLLIVPAILLANSLRIIAIAAIGHVWGASTATGLAHESAGVVFFAVVFLGFMAVGRKWLPKAAVPSGSAVSTKVESAIVVPSARSLAFHGVALGLVTAMLSGIQFHRFQAIPERPSIPFLISGWIGNLDPMSVQEADYYGPRYLEKRHYSRGDEVIDMAIVTSAFSRGNLHEPVACYYLMGWQVRHREVVTLAGGAQPTSASRFSLEFTGSGGKAGKRLACLFWFQSNTGQILAEQQQLILRSLRQRLRLEPEEIWTLYSLATPLDPKREDLAWQRLENLAVRLQQGQAANGAP